MTTSCSAAAAVRAGRYPGCATGRRPSGRSDRRRPARRARCRPSMYERPRPRGPVRCMTSIRPGILRGQPVGDLAGAVRRGVVDDHHAEAVVREHPAHQHRQVVALVVGGNDDEDAWRASRLRPRPAGPAAQTISVGSITGILNRSCGKNIETHQDGRAGHRKSAVGGAVAADKSPRPSRRERQQEQVGQQPMRHDIWSSVAHTTGRSAPRV